MHDSSKLSQSRIHRITEIYMHYEYRTLTLDTPETDLEFQKGTKRIQGRECLCASGVLILPGHSSKLKESDS